MRILRFIGDDACTHFGEQVIANHARIQIRHDVDDRIAFEPTNDERPVHSHLAAIDLPNVLCASTMELIRNSDIYRQKTPVSRETGVLTWLK